MTPSAAPSPWVLAREPASLGDPHELITLVDGQTFCLSGRAGDFSTNPTNGVFFADMRVLSMVRLLVGGATIEPLTVSRTDASSATFIGRAAPSIGDSRLLVLRRRRLGSVWHEELELRNFDTAAVSTVIEIEVAADFADVFAIKEGRQEVTGEHSMEVRENSLLFGWRLGDVHRQAELSCLSDSPVQVTTRGFTCAVTVEPRGTVVLHLDLTVALGGSWIRREHHHPSLPFAAVRNRSWLRSAPRLRTPDTALSAAFDRAIDDLGALRLHDPTGQHRPVIAAGAPWYMTLFGRDALISAYMALPVDPMLALGVLEALAETQGRVVDAASEEEPGRILHEARYLGVDAPSLAGGSPYYGSVDATPLFVVLLGELSRWGLGDDTLRTLLPHADRALAWIADYGDKDGDGYVEYERTSERGLLHQGWKDSVDALRYHDGSMPQPPLALCEVQGYVYAAYRARAAIATRLGETHVGEHYMHLADELKKRFDRDFWLPDLGWYAVALDADKCPVDSLTSNIGHCLWSGIVSTEHAGEVAARLLSPPMWSGWGIRTMAADEPGYDPMSYHRGTVWPHDGALCAAGLRAYGFHREALTVASALLSAAWSFGGRLPELFCGLDRDDVDTPVPFPTSCSPQAWAAASPLLLLRTLLGMEPDDEVGLTIDPIAGAIEDDLVLLGVRRVDRRLDVIIDDGEVKVRASELPEGPAEG